MGSGPSPNLLENRGVEEVPRDVLRLCGGIGSPYSNKMLMYLRYRRIPHRFIMMNSKEEAGTKHARGPVLLPKILWPDGSVQNDSTFLIERLENEYKSRSAYPNHAGMKFLALLLEDFADEFVTKCMFHYRWVYDPVYAGKGIVMQQAGMSSSPDEAVAKAGAGIQKRQVDRIGIVGSNPKTGPAIEHFYKAFLQAVDRHFANGHPFLFGTRPSVADFAILGQLHPMIFLDRETSHLTREISGRVCAWYSYSADLSGLSVVDENNGWLDANKPLPDTFKALLQLVGKWYVPFFIANDIEFKRGNDTFECKLNDGKVAWEQPTFKYQSKCLDWICAQYNALDVASKTFVNKALNGTGCMELFQYGNGANVSKL